MATYQTDFSEYTTSSQPSDWTERWHTTLGTSIVRADGAYTGGKYLEADTSSNARYIATWDEIDSDADRDDVEVLARLESTLYNNTNNSGVVLRGSGSDTTETGYICRRNGGTEVWEIMKYDGAVSTQIDTFTPSGSFSSNNLFFVRFRVNGSDLKAKVWDDGDVEPGSWDLETTDTAITAAGWVGIHTLNASPIISYDTFTVGTNGDTAPDFAAESGIAILDAWTTQTATEDLTKTVSAGSDRLLLVTVGCEDSTACNVTSMTYGGETMFLVGNGTTDAKGSATGGGSDTYLEIWGILEAGIAAASGTTIDVTMDNGDIAEYMIAAGSYEGVDQSGNGSSGSVDDVGTLTTTGTGYTFATGDNIEVTDEGMAFMAVISRASSTFTATSPLAESFDFTTGSASCGGGDDLITANDTAYTSTITATSNNRGVGIIVTFAGAASGSTTFKTLTPLGVGTTSLNKLTTYSRTLTSNAVGTNSIGKGIGKNLSSIATGTSSLTKGMFKALVTTTIGTPSLAKGLLSSLSLSFSSTGTSSLVATSLVGISASPVAVGTVNLIKGIGKTLGSVSIGTSSVTKGIGLTRQTSGVGSISVLKGMNKNLGTSGTGTVSSQEAALLSESSTSFSIGILSTITNFIASSGPAALGKLVHKIACKIGISL